MSLEDGLPPPPKNHPAVAPIAPPKVSPRVMQIISALFIVLVALGVFFALSSGNDGEDYALSYSISVPRDVMVQGDALVYAIRYTNWGTIKSHTAEVSYRLIDENRVPVHEWRDSERMTSVGYRQHQKDVDIPPGRYAITVEVSYGNNQRESATTQYFEIIPSDDTQASPTEIPSLDEHFEIDENVTDMNETTVMNETETINQTTIETNTTTIMNESINEEPTPLANVSSENNSSENTLSIEESTDEELQLLEHALDIVETDPQGAADICYELKTRDSCLAKLSEKMVNAVFCEDILTQTKADNCFLLYVTKTQNYEICENIVHETLKKTCENS